MQFLLIGKDGNDEAALSRRLAARAAHLEYTEKFRKSGKLLFAAALLDDSGKMSGSLLVFNFEHRREIDEYLANEPYVKGKVWQETEMREVAVGNAFLPETMRK